MVVGMLVRLKAWRLWQRRSHVLSRLVFFWTHFLFTTHQKV